MKRGLDLSKRQSCLFLFIFLVGFSIPASSEASLEWPEFADYVEVVSGGYASTNRIRIRIGDHLFYDNIPDGIQTAGLYVVGVKDGEVILNHHYNMWTVPGAGEGLGRDIESLPSGTCVVIGCKDEPTRYFNDRAQQALLSIGATTGLAGQTQRTSYLCIGAKGLTSGQALEQIDMQEVSYLGSKVGQHLELTFPEPPAEPSITTTPGIHEGLMFGYTEVIYYIPASFNPLAAQYLVAIHGAGDWHRPGAMNRVHQFRDIADEKNLVIVAPAFDIIPNWPVVPEVDLPGWEWADLSIIKDWYLWDFIALINSRNAYRTDEKLFEVLDAFNHHLMSRSQFYLYGHSGGGQYVARLAVFYPERILRLGISAAGSYVFPRPDKDYPYGMGIDNLSDFFGPQIVADDLMISQEEFERRFDRMLDIETFIIVGQLDTASDTDPERNWQGAHTYEKALNYYQAMSEEEQRLRDIGVRNPDKEYIWQLHILSGVGHDSQAGAEKAIEVMFQENVKDNLFMTH